MTYKQLREVYGVPYSRVHLGRLIVCDNENVRFPSPVQLSVHRVAFYARCVEAWIVTRKPVEVGIADNDN